MMKLSIAAILIVVCSDGIASTCSMKSVEDITKGSEIAFVGTVAQIEESSYKPWGLCWENSKDKPKCGGKLVTFKVTEKFRGDYGSTVTVVSEDGCYCTGQYWSVNARYLVIANENTSNSPGQFAASNVCGGTGPVEERGDIIEAFRNTAGNG